MAIENKSGLARLVRLARGIECFAEWSGRCVSWLTLALVLLVSYDVTMRYLFQDGSVALQELEWHIFALIFLLGAAYTLKHDEHVRVDLIYHARWMSERRRAWVDLFGTLFFLLPFCILIIVSAWPFVENSYELNEHSPDPGGLPYRYLIKMMIPLCFVLLAVQGVAIIIRSAQKITAGKAGANVVTHKTSQEQDL
ncbi:TRAP dicarboxylate transporter, DctQ subunit, unknown substrate 6 [hydrothermal vent metagenome]|uniref:Tripartite ATP-independent periplasmic transporters DctQ component domain-containing protein n=1 Tax=hydrothermal vent metagenome TaxID=652676 RepID=A0A3B0ZET4_9ZZZZ